ncbi:hypothetical protein GCM10007939_22320 [Amylibacter marinus]|uniref:Group 4 capsule polysaccharide lipoprotein gfcB, YjbF n=1 Tax=Amylibacter marinus TaxID=1475483 RepID=A0ABQ5VWY5_9RHOB|nr:YjbF family lipoprotein [Amylibacter marinus]GLQ35948.1 hypothetical protein GCM10007939_22320 [Amylibacter marinus]
MTRKNAVLLALVSGIGLSACGSKGQERPQIFGGAITQAIVKARQEQKAGPVQQKTVSAQSLEAIKTSVVLVSVPRIGYQSYGTQISDNGGYVNYRTKSQQSFTTNGGQLTGTNGLAFDLMSAETGYGKRVYRFLSSTNSIRTLTVNCEETKTATETIEVHGKNYLTTLTEETCRNASNAFRNRIWRDKSGEPRKAEQWVSFEMGFAVIEWVN